MDTVGWVCDWIQRMAARHGGIVVANDGQRYDWGQALARECYGEDWCNVVPGAPTRDDIDRAVRWEKGHVPSWVARQKGDER